MSDIRFNQWLHQSGTGGVTQISSGHVGIGTTNPLIPVHSTNTATLNVGIITANNIYAGTLNGTLALSNISGITGSFTSDVTINGNLDIVDKIRHIGDTNTAIRFPAADTVSVETGASERLRINSDGQLLVGTTETSPFANRTAMFNKNGGNYISVTTDSSNDCGIVFGDGTANTTANYESYMAHSNSTNDFTIYVNQGSNTRYLRIKSATGHVEIGSGNLVLASGAGIDFSATAGGSSTSGTSELLDDYEEGTWTPALQTTNNNYSGTQTTQEGIYIKVGRSVWVFGRILRGTVTGGSGTVQITGLPFGSNHGGQYESVVHFGYRTGVGYASLTGYVSTTTDRLNLAYNDSNATYNVSVGALSSGWLYFSCHYYADS